MKITLHNGPGGPYIVTGLTDVEGYAHWVTHHWETGVPGPKLSSYAPFIEMEVPTLFGVSEDEILIPWVEAMSSPMVYRGKKGGEIYDAALVLAHLNVGRPRHEINVVIV